jgi:hypothetical protein
VPQQPRQQRHRLNSSNPDEFFVNVSKSQLRRSQFSMAKVKLGTKSFSADSEKIDASSSQVTDADCVAFCARLSADEFEKLRVLKLVRAFLFICWFLFCACFVVARSQGG